jgi:quinol monooxygenase YgiN
MLVVTRYRVAPDDEVPFAADAERALDALAGRPGCTGAVLGRAVDEPALWTLTTTWESVGAYRRALSSYEVKLHAVPVMYRAVDEPSAYQALLSWTPDGGRREADYHRSPDADRAGPQPRQGGAGSAAGSL